MLVHPELKKYYRWASTPSKERCDRCRGCTDYLNHCRWGLTDESCHSKGAIPCRECLFWTGTGVNELGLRRQTEMLRGYIECERQKRKLSRNSMHRIAKSAQNAVHSEPDGVTQISERTYAPTHERR